MGVETFGALGPELLALLREAAAFKNNKLSAAEYDGETTWSARTWLSFAHQQVSVAHQQVSVALHRAVAWEIGTALGVPSRAGADPRGACVPHILGG